MEHGLEEELISNGIANFRWAAKYADLRILVHQRKRTVQWYINNGYKTSSVGGGGVYEFEM